MAYWIEQKKLRMARAAASKDWENPEALKRMRHMAKAGATADDIASALQWGDVCAATISARLKKYNIIAARNKHGGRVRNGTSDPYHRGPVSQASYRPKIVK